MQHTKKSHNMSITEQDVKKMIKLPRDAHDRPISVQRTPTIAGQSNLFF